MACSCLFCLPVVPFQSQANQSSDQCSLAATQDDNRKANHLKVVYYYGGSSSTPPAKAACSITFLKCRYTNTVSMGNKQDKLEIRVKSQGHDALQLQRHGGIACTTGMLARMSTYFLEKTGLECIELYTGVDEEQANSPLLWVFA